MYDIQVKCPGCGGGTITAFHQATEVWVPVVDNGLVLWDYKDTYHDGGPGDQDTFECDNCGHGFLRFEAKALVLDSWRAQHHG